MINENAMAEANAKVIADMNKEQASFMEVRALMREIEERKMADKQNS